MFVQKNPHGLLYMRRITGIVAALSISGWTMCAHTVQNGVSVLFAQEAGEARSGGGLGEVWSGDTQEGRWEDERRKGQKVQQVPNAADGSDVVDDGFERAVLAVSGAGDLSELSESEMERYYGLLRHPVNVNADGHSRLEEVLDTWRAASVLDYRSRCGDILSWTELASVDGFNAGMVSVLKPFLSIEPSAGRHGIPGRGTDVLLRSTVKGDEDGSAVYDYAAKYRYSGPRLSLAMTIKRLSASPSFVPETLGFGAEYRARRHPLRIVLGDYHARFGQGLALWSGFSMSGFGTVDAFRRKATGIRQAWTLSTDYALRGAAVEWDSGIGTLSGMLTQDGLLGGNLRRTGKRSSMGMTAYMTVVPDGGGRREGMVAADCRWTPWRVLRHCELFAEAGYDLAACRAAFVGGVIWTPAYRRRYALMLRSYPDGMRGSHAGAPRAFSSLGDETGAAVGMKTATVSGWQLGITADAAVRPVGRSSQLRTIADAAMPVAGWLVIKPRLTWRLRPADKVPERTDLRIDADVAAGAWSGRMRAEAVWYESASCLYYVEAGYKTGRVAVHARTTAFAADRWNDRIYSYERDVPGMFTVPAYYGRGLACQAICSLRVGRGRIYLRTAMTHYTAGRLRDGGRVAKPDSFSLRVQYSASF